MKLNYCNRCLFPETKPDLSFDDLGICSACQAAEQKYKNIDWSKEKLNLRKF